MFNVNSETICRLIEIAREFHSREETVIDAEPIGLDDEPVLRVLAEDYDADTAFQEFRSIVNDLETDQQIELVALFWLGRGDFTKANWQGALAEARRSWNPRSAEYLIAHPQVADCLTDGLYQFDLSCE